MKTFYRGEVTERIIRCAHTVFYELGNGFQEVIYQRALALEMQAQGIPFEREASIDIYYKEQHIGDRRVDFLIEGNLCIEIKALHDIDNSHIAQVRSYIDVFKLEIGLLLNFGSGRLQIRRLEKRSEAFTKDKS